MKITKKYTFEDLLNISKEELNAWKGLTIHVLKKNDQELEGIIIGFELASNHPYLPCGFILKDSTHVSFQSINIVDLYE